MTLPSTTILPPYSEKSNGDGKGLESYMQELIFTLQNQYENIAQAVNGDIRSNVDTESRRYTPVLNGSTEGTFTYTNQTGWVLRKGIMVDVWGDIEWSAVGTAAGNLYVELPYKTALSAQTPFIGVVQAASVAYAAGTAININAIPDTYRGEFFNTGDGVALTNQDVVATGRLMFHIRYIGQSIERP